MTHSNGKEREQEIGRDKETQTVAHQSMLKSHMMPHTHLLAHDSDNNISHNH